MKTWIVLLCVVGTVVLTAGLNAAPRTFARADAEWYKGAIEESRALYEQALAEGGLVPQEVVLAYSRIGTVKAALGEREAALSDFRVAAAIDPKFELAADSGPIARDLHERARQEAAAQGEALSITLSMPSGVPASRPFKLETLIPEGFAVLVAEIVITIEDPVTGQKWRRRKPAQAEASFAFPDRVAVQGARLRVRAGAVDQNDNEWAVALGELFVAGKRESAIPMVGNGASSLDESHDHAWRTRKPFLKRPLPWIVAGGVVAVGAALVVVATRPRDVEVGSPRWQ